jgi:hypothetical protein
LKCSTSNNPKTEEEKCVMKSGTITLSPSKRERLAISSFYFILKELFSRAKHNTAEDELYPGFFSVY